MPSTPVAQEPYPPPAAGRPEVRLRPKAWLRQNLFSSWFNGLLTVVFGVVLAVAAFRMLRFVLVTADWEIVRRNLTTFMVGRFDREELWRPWVASFVLAATLGFTIGAVATETAVDEDADGGEASARPGLVPTVRRFWPLLLLAVAVLSFTRTIPPTLLVGGVVAVGVAARAAGSRLPRRVARLWWAFVVVGLVVALQAVVGFGGIGWDRWGGLQLTVFATVGGIVLAFPLGLLLALGRRSSLPAVRTVSVAYIEFFRGVPLITLLLMGQFMIGLFFPAGASTPSTLTRALIAIVLFEAAYVAEIVRGGLQSVPRGQYEAAQAMGMSPWRVTRLVVLPQALRAVIPAMVGQFISLFKDTSLLAIVGFFEILDVALSVTSQPEFLGQGLHAVTLAFVGFIYWVGSFTMSRESQRLERRLGVGQR